MFGTTLTSNNRAILFQVVTLALPAFQLFRIWLRLLDFLHMQFVGTVMLVTNGVFAAVG